MDDKLGSSCKQWEAWAEPGETGKQKLTLLGVSMNVFVFLAGALVGAYYNTAVLTVASACAGACTKGAHLILQLVA